MSGALGILPSFPYSSKPAPPHLSLLSNAEPTGVQAPPCERGLILRESAPSGSGRSLKPQVDEKEARCFRSEPTVSAPLSERITHEKGA